MLTSFVHVEPVLLYSCCCSHNIYSYHFTVSPQVSRITSEVVAVPIGENIQLLVIYSGGFPDPQVSWSHQVGNDFINVSQDQRASFSGTFELNFTLSEAVVSDGGLYRLTVMNSVETVELEFTVSIQGLYMWEILVLFS